MGLKICSIHFSLYINTIYIFPPINIYIFWSGFIIAILQIFMLLRYFFIWPNQYFFPFSIFIIFYRLSLKDLLEDQPGNWTIKEFFFKMDLIERAEPISAQKRIKILRNCLVIFIKNWNMNIVYVLNTRDKKQHRV